MKSRACLLTRIWAAIVFSSGVAAAAPARTVYVDANGTGDYARSVLGSLTRRGLVDGPQPDRPQDKNSDDPQSLFVQSQNNKKAYVGLRYRF